MNLNDPALVIIYVVLSVALSSVISFFMSRYMSKEGYFTNRSEYITRARFDKEIRCMQGLSKELLLLIQLTKMCAVVQNRQNERKWAEQRIKVISMIGESAPFLNYLDLSSEGIPYCGVKRRLSKKGFEKEAEAYFCHSNTVVTDTVQKECLCQNPEKDTKPKLILEGHIDELHIECSALKRQMSSKKNASGENDHSGKGFLSKNLYMRACEILKLCEKAHNTSDFSCSEERCNGALNSPHEYRTYLDCRYARFINCAYCRLNAIEYGQKDLRKHNKQEMKQKRKEFCKGYERSGLSFDQSCPYEGIIQGQAESISEESERD